MRFNFYLVIGIISITSFSCEKSESALVETETSLSIDVLMTTENYSLNKFGTNSSELDYPFSGEGTYSGIKIINFENRLYQIQNVKPHTAPFLSIPGVMEGDEFRSLTLEWGFKGSADNDYIMQESIDLLPFEHQLVEGVFKVKLDKALIQMINNLDNYPENSIKIKLTGTSNFNFNKTANLKIPVLVESETMNLRFELF